MDTSTGFTLLRELRRRFVPAESVSADEMDELDHWLQYYTACMGGGRLPLSQAPPEYGARAPNGEGARAPNGE